MELDSNTLFAANTIILLIMALAFLSAYLNHQRERYWLNWLGANIALAGALVLFIFEDALPPLAVTALAHGLLVLGFGLRYVAARQFSGRRPLRLAAFGPTVLLLALSAIPFVLATPSVYFALSNLILAAVAGLVVFEFWRDRADRLPSRLGLCAVYSLMAISFAFRASQGLFAGPEVLDYLPRDDLLIAHLTIAIIHTTGAGAFALGIAYERSAVQLRLDARSDSLTQLLNRRAFEEQVTTAIGNRDGRSFALILLDIDHFKRVNDRYGHAVGDEALRACAEVFRKVMRAEDAVARIGGEEFAVIVRDVSEEKAHAVAERVRLALGKITIDTPLGPMRLTMSAGLYFSPSGPTDFDQIIQSADAALYKAKRNGRNRIELAAA